MESKPLVSVLICAYNVEQYIEECINAVINQTYSNLEIIIVNDGSSDNTYFLLKKLAKKDNR
ncbi:glycosyltransferase family 2 protein, partial [Bisgaard Taxon 45]